MSIYYVDLSIDTNPGYLVNDPNNPMGWAEFQPFYQFGGSLTHEMRIRGIRDASAQNKLTGGLLLKAWNLNQYGPWRLKINTIGNNSGTLSNETWRIQDAIIESHNFIHMAGAVETACTISNCFIRSNYLTFTSALSAPMTVNVKGSTIRVNTTIQGIDPVINILDSINDWPNSKTFSNSSTFTNTVFNRSNSWTGISSITDCQFDWLPPIWPAWTAAKSAWSAVIATGINTPPQPGNAPYTDYSTGLFGNPRQGIGGLYFSVNKLFLTQRTNRHVVKSLVLPQSGNAYYSNHFGTYGVSGNSSSLLNSPWNIVSHSSGYFFVCDHNNERIIKLDGDLNFVSQYSTSSTIGKPCAILAENDLYVVGINYHTIENDVLYMYINIEKLDSNLNSLKFTWDILGVNQRLEQRKGEIGFKPISVIRGYSLNELLIFGIRKNIYSTIEYENNFSTLVKKEYYKELPVRFVGAIKHSNGFVYLNSGNKINKYQVNLTENFGSQEITNGTFDTDVSSWSYDNNALITWNTGKANISGMSSIAPLDRIRNNTIQLQNNIKYRLTFEISNLNSGTAIVKWRMSNIKLFKDGSIIDLDGQILSNGIYGPFDFYGSDSTEVFELLVETAGTEKTLTIDNVSIRQIIDSELSFTNVADSDVIGKTIIALKERLNGNLVTYKIDNQSIVEYDSDLNFVQEIFIDSGETIQTDLYDVIDFVEASY